MLERARRFSLRFVVSPGFMVGLVISMLALAGGGAVAASAQQPVVEKFILKDTIQPVTVDELNRALARASADGARALLVEMDTPGGLVESMRAMAGAILGSKVPVIVYVGPSGARAGSAGDS